jgi:hypothetical protein
MAISSEVSCYLNQPSSKRFSVRKVEAKALKVATAVQEVVKNSSDRNGDLISFIASNTSMTWFRTVQMLNGIGRVKSPFDALRIGFAMLHYPRCFEEETNQLDPPYLGDPIFPVHGRVLDCFVSEIRGREIVIMKFLAMNSIFAGRIYKLHCSSYVADKLIRKVYSVKSEAPFVGISGCYFWLNSDLLFREITKRDMSDGVGANAEEKDINKNLYKSRGDLDTVRSCSEPKYVSCYACTVPRSQCRLSTRHKRKEENNDIFTEVERTETGDDE